MIKHITIHGTQYTATPTDKQLERAARLGIENNLSFHIDGMVSAYEWDDYGVKAYTIYRDGRCIIESRDFIGDGWDTEEIGADDE